MAASIRHVRDFQKCLQKSKILQKTIGFSVLKHRGTQSRFHHLLSTNSRNGGVPVLWRNKKSQICAVFIQRNNSKDATANTVEELQEPSFDFDFGEPTFASLDLGHNNPAGLVQNALEFLHVSCGLPWWGSIVACTLVLRLMVFPLVINAERYNIKLYKHLPILCQMSHAAYLAKYNSDMKKYKKEAREYHKYLKEHDLKICKKIRLVPIAQAAILLNSMYGLSKMAYLPVESLKTGGLFWFTDLTVPDPYYVLPVLTMIGLTATTEFGSDGYDKYQVQEYIRSIVLWTPIVLMYFVCQLPAALCFYWLTYSTVSLLSISFLKIPAVKKCLNIPEKGVWEQSLLIQRPKFTDSFIHSWIRPVKMEPISEVIKKRDEKNIPVINRTELNVEHRKRADTMRYQLSDVGPVMNPFRRNRIHRDVVITLTPKPKIKPIR